MKLPLLPACLLGGSAAFASSLQKPLSNGLSADTRPVHIPSAATGGSPGYRDALLSLHKQLIEISSVSGNENAVGTFLVEYLTERNFHAQLEFIPPSSNSSSSTSSVDADDAKPRFNVLAWPGAKRNPDPKLLVSSHIDTVPPFIPYSSSDPEPNADTVISGRGSVDAKAAVAAQVIAVLELLEAQKVKGKDVMLLFVVGEEVDGDGMRYFSATLDELEPPPRFEAAIFGEPTEGKLACGHKGLVGCEVYARGHAGHSGYPWLGKSATEVLMRGLVKVLDTDLGSSERFGNTTVNIGRIEGGVAANVIPEKAHADIVLRVAIGPQDGSESGGQIVKERLWETLKSVDDEAFEMNCHNIYGAVDCDCEVSGFENITVNYGTDVPNLKGNHTRYLYGPGSILVAHGPDEAIKVKELEQAVEDYKKLVLHVLGN
ncbi:acetylornithine deacetylase [Apiospora kogelbergensis]|uniref:Acetylornithine deacetylase n=1 Tax=Apiospora kogelbergensis TaxID=1337665 RepID=A0AAW0QTS9_9PEZI